MLHILLVDDDADFLHWLEQVLRDEGHTVTVAPDSETAIERLGSCSFDLVMSDVRLPKDDGLTLLHRIRRDFPLTEVLLMTAYGSIGDAVTAVKDSAVDYLRKPFEVAHVVTVMEQIEQRRRSKDELAE